VTYIKPPAFTRKVFNPIAMRFGLSGTHALEVPGRRSGRPLRVPVIPVEHGAGRYLVSTRGESDWVRNVRADGRARLARKGSVEEVRATEVPVAERPPVIDAYRAKAGRMTDPYWKRLPDPADHPVFRLERFSGTGA
jgi:deazaflavin-dependent oxidoreductase (nitroreductase family)